MCNAEGFHRCGGRSGRQAGQGSIRPDNEATGARHATGELRKRVDQRILVREAIEVIRLAGQDRGEFRTIGQEVLTIFASLGNEPLSLPSPASTVAHGVMECFPVLIEQRIEQFPAHDEGRGEGCR